MGNEMGNNNTTTTTIKEEDKISEGNDKNLLEDTSEHSQDAHAHNVMEENHIPSSSIAKDDMEKDSNSSNDITIALGKDTPQEDGHADDVNGKIQTMPTAETKDNTASMLENDLLEGDAHASDMNLENQMHPTAEAEHVQDEATGLASEDTTTENQMHPTTTAEEFGDVSLHEEIHGVEVKDTIQMIPTDEAKYVEEKAEGLISNHTESMIENDSLEGDIHECDMNLENQMHPTDEAEDVQEIATGLASEETTTELEEVSMQEESHGDEGKDQIQMIPTAEAKDVEEKAAELISNNTESMIENDSLEGDAHQSDMNLENIVHSTDEAEDVQEKTTGMASDHTRSPPENDLLKCKGDQEIGAKLDYDDKTSELEGKLQEDSDEPLNLTNSFGVEGEEMTGVRQTEKSPHAESVEGENSESLSSSSLEGTEECGKQEDSCLRKHLSLTYNHHLNDQSSIKQDEQETTVISLNSANTSNDSELHESLSLHHDEVVKSLSEHSLQGTQPLLKDTLLDADSHFQLIKDDVSEKDIESQEKLLVANNSDGNEFGNGLIDTSEATSDLPSIGNNNNSNNGNLLTKINYTTEDCLNPFPESFVMDNSPKSDHEQNFKVLDKENNLSTCGPTNENPQDYKPDQCMEELKEYKSDMVNIDDFTVGSNGDLNEEKETVLDAGVFDIVTSDLVGELNVTENGLQFDAYVNKSNKAPVEKHSVVPEAGAAFLIAGSTVADCIHDQGENHNNKMEDTKEEPEASSAMVKTFEETHMSEQFNSDLVTINHEECFSLQNSASLLHIYNYHQGNAEQTKSFTATVEKLDFSKLTVPSLDLEDEEAIEKEREDYSHNEEAASLIVAELTTSAATISTEPCSSNSILATNGGYDETRDSVTRLSTESNPDNPNISCQIQKSPSFNLNLRIEARSGESDQTPLLYQETEILSKQTGLNLSNSMPHHAEYDECMLHNVTMPVEEKIVTMERSYSEISKASFIGLLKEEEEEGHLLVIAQTQDNHADTKNDVKEVSSTSPEGKEKRKSRPYLFFSSCMCCATVAN